MAALFAASSLAMLAACNAVLGLGDYEKVTCARDCDAATDAPVDTGAAPGDAAVDVGLDVEAGSYSPARGWASWRMPNPVDEAGLPNPHKYDGGADAGIIYDERTALTWEASISAPSIDAVAASARCTSLSASRFGAYTDWRLPTRIELVSIVDYTRDAGAAIDPVFARTPGDRFWTQSPLPPPKSGFWMIDFTNGATDTTHTTAYARCVRGGTR